MDDFFAAQFLDELFLTLASQIAGREVPIERPGLVMGKRFALEHLLLGTQRPGSHLFLCYVFEAVAQV